MKRLTAKSEENYIEVQRFEPDYKHGLSKEQVLSRREDGLVNVQEDNLTPTIPKIILRNTLTLFNLINVFLAVMIILVGHIENTLFMGVVFCNLFMGIWQEIRSKKTLDKLSLLAQAKVSVIREGGLTKVTQDKLVLDDIVFLKTGDQICADGVIISAKGLEADESLLTGETDRIQKEEGDQVLSGSYITGGQAYAQVMAVGKDNYAAGIAKEAKKSRKNKSKLLLALNKIIQFVTVSIVPLGLILFYTSYSSGENIKSAVLGTSAAIIGMIPSGLVLLTSITLTVGAMNLAKKKALVQSLPSIETLARVDVLCLDKTGTITDGTMVFEKMELTQENTPDEIKQIVAELMGTLQDTNATAECLTNLFGTSNKWNAIEQIPFSSDRKWSGAVYEGKGSYILGAPNIIFQGQEPELLERVNQFASEGYRVLCLGYSEAPIVDKSLPEKLSYKAMFLLTDRLRQNAKETFAYFTNEGVELKVISGDNPRTVSAVAQKAEIANADKSFDMNEIAIDADLEEYQRIAAEYTVFGHVKPEQKQKLILALQRNGHTTCMTGDGVNDILAMRESDCSVAMVSGSEAARSACDFVLMSSDFSSMVNVLKEGRRVINNIERVAALYIVNTVYSMLLTLVYSFLAFAYPYAPLQMTPINGLTVGIPSFILALERNYKKPKGRLAANIMEHAIPAALTIVFNTLYIQLASVSFIITAGESSTMIVFMIGIVGFYLLLRVVRPLNKKNKIMLYTLMGAFAILFIFFSNYFMYEGLFSKNLFFVVPLLYFSYHIHDFLGKWNHKIVSYIFKKRRKEIKFY